MSKFLSEVVFVDNLPSVKKVAENPLIIFDSHLLKNPEIKKWLRRFENNYPVQAGEKLKQIKSFEVHALKILQMIEKRKLKNITLVALGGGSVGDFVGFLASVFKRGVPLVQIPSTWLSAIDSAHGGKTALNVDGYKNQIGTYYQAQRVIICRDLLETQPPDRLNDAMGEVLKTALLSGGKLWRNINREDFFDNQLLWSYLPQLIEYKYKIVTKDPFEKKGLRHVLNLGHTFGHAIEANNKWSHGTAVNFGLAIALEFSLQKKILTTKKSSLIYSTPLMQNYLVEKTDVVQCLRKITDLSSYLLHDKKMSAKGHIKFVFLEGPGKPKVIETSVLEMITFAKRFCE